MLNAIAIKEITKYGRQTGFRLRDENGNEMDVPTHAIIGAIREGKINITNLDFTPGGRLQIIPNNSKKPEEKELKQLYNFETDKKVEVKPEVKPVNKENKTGTQSDVERMHYLVNLLNKARKVYEQGKDEIMSNYEYDKLYDELEALEKKLGTTMSNSPTINIGYEVISALPKEKHTETMMSLEKTKDMSSAASFLGNQEGVLGWKMDGLTVVLTYRNGLLEKAVTRGNGEIGEVVTSNAKHFINIPHKINYNSELIIRGEAIITYTDFEKINSRLVADEKYKNPRNLASGSVRQLDSRITAQRNVRFVAFTLVNPESHGVKTVEQSYQLMHNLGFTVVQNAKVNKVNVMSEINKFTTAVQNNKIDFPVDGLVLTYNDIAYGKGLGRTAKTPRHSIALKWQDETAETRLIDIEWSASKTGLLNPVAIFEPVDLEGSTVSRASVHNVSILSQLELGYGDRIRVYKANMIIPQISENLTRSGTCEIPDYCPVCGGATEIYMEPDSGVYTLYCTNPECSAKGNRLLKHFVTRDAMNIDGISGATLATLVDCGIVDTFASIFRIKNHPEIMNIEGFGQKSFQNMCVAIEKARNVKLHNLIYALSIPNIGLQTAKDICKYFNNDLKATVTASYVQLVSIPGIGDTIASSFYNYFHSSKENVDNFMDLLNELNVIQEEVIRADSSDPMFGKTFCVTGKVYIFPNRDAVKAVIESRGGKLTGSVSKSTDFLVTNDTESGSNKNKAAKQYGVPVISEQQFIEMFKVTM